MLRPFSPEEGRVREMEIRTAVTRAVRGREASCASSARPPCEKSSAGPAIALAAALRRLADRLDARPVPGSPAPSARGVATS